MEINDKYLILLIGNKTPTQYILIVVSLPPTPSKPGSSYLPIPSNFLHTLSFFLEKKVKGKANKSKLINNDKIIIMRTIKSKYKTHQKLKY